MVRYLGAARLSESDADGMEMITLLWLTGSDMELWYGLGLEGRDGTQLWEKLYE